MNGGARFTQGVQVQGNLEVVGAITELSSLSAKETYGPCRQARPSKPCRN